MKKLLLSIFVFTICALKAQNYTQGIAVDTVIYSGTYSFPGNSCPSMTFAEIELDPALYNYVNGLQFMILVDTVTMGPPPQFSPVHAGDTFLLNAATPSYFTPASVVFNFRLKLVGTPTTAGQNFSCNLDFMQCTCNCYHMDIIPSLTNTTVCTVGVSSKVDELTKQSLVPYPNPVINSLVVSGISQQTIIKLYNNFGVLVMEQISNCDVTLEIDSLPNGIYTLVASSDLDKIGVVKKVVIAR